MSGNENIKYREVKKNKKQLTGVIWAVLDECRELCKNVSPHVKRLLVDGAEMRIPAGDRRKVEDEHHHHDTGHNHYMRETITWAGPAFVRETPRF